MSEYITINTDMHQIVTLAPVDAVNSASWIISVGAFFDRFGGDKWGVLSSTSPVVQALIKDVSVRKFIDLSRPDLSTAIDIVISAGFGVNKNAILNTPCSKGEEP